MDVSHSRFFDYARRIRFLLFYSLYTAFFIALRNLFTRSVGSVE